MNSLPKNCSSNC